MATVATRLGREETDQQNHKTNLTPTGLLMEGDFTHNDSKPQLSLLQELPAWRTNSLLRTTNFRARICLRIAGHKERSHVRTR